MLLIVSASSVLLTARRPASAAHMQPRCLLHLCSSDPNPLKRVADSSGDAVDLGDSASDATSSLEGLADAAAARLNAMGAGEPRVEAVDAGPSRSAFGISRTGAAERAEMDERLRRLENAGPKPKPIVLPTATPLQFDPIPALPSEGTRAAVGQWTGRPAAADC